MAPSFLEEIVALTKDARTKTFRAELDRDAAVLLKFFEKKIKELVLTEATAGGSYITLNMSEFSFDYMSNWSIDQLLYEDLYTGYVPVFEQLFGKGSLFDGFEVMYIDDKNFNLIWETDPEANRIEIKQEEVASTPVATPVQAQVPGAPKPKPFLGECECNPCACDICQCDPYSYDPVASDYEQYYNELNNVMRNLFPSYLNV